MNWYKEADFWNKAIAASLLAFIPVLGHIGWTKTDLFDSFKRNNGDITAVRKEIQKAMPAEAEAEQNIAFPYESFINRLTQSEGSRPRAYDDGAGNLTIGIGHLITPQSRDIFRQLFGNNVNYNEIVSGQSELTNNQINTLARRDIDEHLDRARGIFPDLATYPGYFQEALVDSVYRGDMGPQTTSLINNGEIAAAADEYINHAGYRSAPGRGMGGIVRRMDANREAMLQYARELEEN